MAGPIFVLTHHPEDAQETEGITFLSCPVEEAVQTALDAAAGRNLEVLPPTIGRQLLGQGLIDEIDLHIAPILLGDGIRLYDNPGGKPIRLHGVGYGDRTAALNVRYQPIPTHRLIATQFHSEEEMMGRFEYWMNVSLDLRIEQVTGGDGAGDWLRIGEELHREYNAQARTLALMVEGRVIYETMEAFWPRAREDASLPDYLREYGEIWTAKPKVLVSRTRDSAEYNTKIIGGGDAIEQLAAIRARTDGAIGVGGAALATQLLRAGLLDELLLFTHPAILGLGRPLFDDYNEPIELELLEQRSFEQGVAMHRYAIRDAHKASPC